MGLKALPWNKTYTKSLASARWDSASMAGRVTSRPQEGRMKGRRIRAGTTVRCMASAQDPCPEEPYDLTYWPGTHLMSSILFVFSL